MKRVFSDGDWAGVSEPTKVAAFEVLARRTLEAVATLHDRQVVHRDLHPGNLTVDADGVVKVIDFGMAKRFDEPDLAVSMEYGTGRGGLFTPNELQGRGALNDPNLRSRGNFDVYSVGQMFDALRSGESGRIARLLPPREPVLDERLGGQLIRNGQPVWQPRARPSPRPTRRGPRLVPQRGSGPAPGGCARGARFARRPGLLARGAREGRAAAFHLERDAAWKPDVERTIVRGPAVWPRPEDGKHEVASQAATGQARMTVTTPSDPTVPRAEGPAEGTPTPDAAAKLHEPTGASPDRISLDDFMRVDLRVARVVAAERVPKSKKLVKMVVDIGPEQRTLVAGIAEAYDAERLVGRTVVVVANLRPAVLMGVESNGMVLAASPEGGKPELVGFEVPPVPGTRVR